MKKITLLFALFFLVTINLKAQYPSYQWSGVMPTGSASKNTVCAEDPSGNVYIGGSFSGTMDFDFGPGTYTIAAAGQWAYIAKYSSSGSFIWARAVISNTNSSAVARINQIKVDNSGNPVIVGLTTHSNNDFDPGPTFYSPPNPTASGSYPNGYVAKYDANGNYIWAQIMYHSGAPLNTNALDVIIDNTNTAVRVTASSGVSAFSTTMIYAQTTGCNFSIASSPTVTSYGYVLSYNLNTGAGYTPGSQSYSTGKDTYAGYLDIDNSGNFYHAYTALVLSGNYNQLRMNKRSSSGASLWSASVGASGARVLANDVSIDASMNVYVHGTFTNTVDFDASASSATLASLGQDDNFLLQYSTTGTYMWCGQLGNPSNDYPGTIAIDKTTGYIYLEAHIRNGAATDVDFGPGVTTFSTATTDELVFLKYDAAKNFVWGTKAGGSNNNDQVYVSNAGNIYFSGYLTTPFDFNFSASVNTISGGGYVAKYTGCASAPAAPGTIIGNSSFCPGAGIQIYSTAPVSGATSYTWSLPGGWTGTSSTNTISATTGTTSGNISVTANNACGSSSASVLSVTVNPNPTISVNSGSICSGSSFTLSPSGASTYTFSSGSAIVSPTTTTSYSVTGTSAAGCVGSNTAVASVTVNSIPVASASTTQTLTCVNASATLNGSGVSSYTWSGPGIVSGGNTASPIVNIPGTYSLVGSTSGCNSNTATVIVSSNTVAPTLSVAASSNSICIGNSATLTASGASTYSWSTSATTASVVVSPTTTTNYIVTGTNSVNGCTSSINHSVGVNPLPIVTANTSNSVICGPPFQGTATITASGASTYTWNTSATTTAIAVSPSITTTYTITGTDGNGCVNTASFTQSVSSCTGLEQFGVGIPIAIGTEFVVYPNPTSGSITIKAKEGLQVEVYNVIGELIFSTELKSETMELDLSDKANGIYFIRVGSVTGKIVKE